MATKTYNKKKVVINDEYERFVEDEDFTGVGLRYNSEENTFNVVIPKKRVRNDEGPEHLSDGQYADMYFSKSTTGRYNFHLTVNIREFKAHGIDKMTEDFRSCLETFMEKVG